MARSMKSGVVDPRRKAPADVSSTQVVTPAKRTRAGSDEQSKPISHEPMVVTGALDRSRRARKGSIKRAIQGGMRGSAKKMTKTLRRIGSSSRKEPMVQSSTGSEATSQNNDPWQRLQFKEDNDAR